MGNSNITLPNGFGQERNVTDIPERWVILKLANGIYKVFGVWLNDERWKLNSGIDRVEEDKDFYYIFGISGSCYKCCKNFYGITNSYGCAILNGILNTGVVEIVENMTDFLNTYK